MAVWGRSLKNEAPFQTVWNRWLRSDEGKLFVKWLGLGGAGDWKEFRNRGGLEATRRAGGFAVAMELKIVKCRGLKGCGGVSGVCEAGLGFSKVEEGQWEALQRVNSGFGPSCGWDSLVYKVGDFSHGYKPFDCFFMGGGVPAGLVVLWQCEKAGPRVGWIAIDRAMDIKNHAGGRGF